MSPHRPQLAQRLQSGSTVLLACALTACAPTSAPPVTTAPIVAGTLAPDDVAVVAVRSPFEGCSGTLVGDRLALTAKHCVQAAGAAGPLSPTAVRVLVGSHVDASESYGVREIVTTPGAYSGTITDGSDIAVLVLDRATGVSPLAVLRSDATEWLGQPGRAVGFGATAVGETGARYASAVVVEEITGVALFARDALCPGDSGGPLVVDVAGTPRVIGLASYAEVSPDGGLCPGARDAWVRLDRHLALLDDTAARTGACVRGDLCDRLDNDCDGTIDEDCADASVVPVDGGTDPDTGGVDHDPVDAATVSAAQPATCVVGMARPSIALTVTLMLLALCTCFRASRRRYGRQVQRAPASHASPSGSRHSSPARH